MEIMRMDSNDQQTPNGLDTSSLDPGKIFVGGLSWQTTNETLRQYFSQFGDIVECMVMKDQATKRSRGFGFVNFADPSSVEKVLASGPHDIDSKRVDPKKSFPRPKLIDGQTKLVTKTKKMFVGGLSASTTIEDVKSYFEQFGKVEDAMLMYDKQTQRHRGFAFVTFESEDTVDKVVDVHYHDVNNKTVECKKAQPKSLMDPPPMKGVIPVGLTPVLATACGRSGFPIAGLPQYYAYTGLPYGYVATGTGSGAAAVTASDRLGQTGGGGAGGGTTYYATASPDYGTPVSVVSIPRGGGAPTSPPIRGDQYVLQRILHGQASRGSGLLSLHDFSSNELGIMNGYAGSAAYSALSPIHNGPSAAAGTLIPFGATFPAAAMAGLHAGYQ